MQRESCAALAQRWALQAQIILNWSFDASAQHFIAGDQRSQTWRKRVGKHIICYLILYQRHACLVACSHSQQLVCRRKHIICQKQIYTSDTHAWWRAHIASSWYVEGNIYLFEHIFVPATRMRSGVLTLLAAGMSKGTYDLFKNKFLSYRYACLVAC